MAPRRTFPFSFALALAVLALASAAAAVLYWHTHQAPVFAKRALLQTSRIKSGNGKAFKTTLPRQHSLSEEAISRSDLLENGTPLKPAGAISDIEQAGGGLFRIKSSGIWFAPSDDSSPLTNGRRYEVRTVWKAPARLLPLSVALLGLAAAALIARPAAKVGRFAILGITRVLGWISIPDASMDAAPFPQNAPDPDRS